MNNIFKNVKTYLLSLMPQRALDWQSVGLTVVLVQIAAVRLVISGWVPKLEIIQIISFYAIALGLLMGYGSMQRNRVAWMAFEFGILLIPWQLLYTVDEANRSAFVDQNLREIFSRIFDSILLFIQNKPIYDSLFFVFLTAIGFWIVGTYVGYRLTRHNDFLDAIFAPGVIILVVQMYDPWVPLRIWALAVYLFFSLILLGRMYYLENKKGWNKGNFFRSPDMEMEFSRTILISAALAVVIAWSIPEVLTSIKPAASAWRRVMRPFTDRVANGFKALESPYGGSTPSSNFYGSDLRLGNFTPTGEIPVFYVQVENSDTDVLRYYWRGRIYDKYENGQWVATSSTEKSFNSKKDEIEISNPNNRTEVKIKFTVNFPEQELVYAPTELTWIDRDGKMIMDSKEGNPQETLALLATSSFVAGDMYEVRALIATPTIQELQRASIQYPTWIKEEYLQVPENIRPPLQQLAEEITSSATNPYDKAQAITLYLRQEISYQSSITENVPSGKDPLLWVLFDYKKGFCMYSASAEVLLLRSIGIPARMAVGFAEGEYDGQTDRYTVSRLDAHAWPEVYFPEIGWIEFEPTGNQDPLNRPQERIISPTNNTASTPQIGPINSESSGREPSAAIEEGVQPTTETASNWTRYVYHALFIIFLAVAIYLVKTYSLTKRLPVYLTERYAQNGTQPPNWLANWVRWTNFLPIERAYHAINISLRWIGHPQPQYKTPTERANILKQAIPSALDAVDELTRQYQNALFTARPVNLTIARRASLKLLYKTWQVRTFNGKSIKKRYN
ncbi:MAG: transglutaminase domain-containing protein [Anaerolineales bacterium]